MSKESMKLALEALEKSARNWPSDSIIEAITALRSALAEQPAQQEPEPLSNEEISVWAYRHDIQGTPLSLRCMVEDAASLRPTMPPAPQPAKPLTDAEIWNAIRPLTQSDEVCKALIAVSIDEYRAIEAAHGIKENT